MAKTTTRKSTPAPTVRPTAARASTPRPRSGSRASAQILPFDRPEDAQPTPPLIPAIRAMHDAVVQHILGQPSLGYDEAGARALVESTWATSPDTVWEWHREARQTTLTDTPGTPKAPDAPPTSRRAHGGRSTGGVATTPATPPADEPGDPSGDLGDGSGALDDASAPGLPSIPQPFWEANDGPPDLMDLLGDEERAEDAGALLLLLEDLKAAEEAADRVKDLRDQIKQAMFRMRCPKLRLPLYHPKAYISLARGANVTLDRRELLAAGVTTDQLLRATVRKPYNYVTVSFGKEEK